MTSVEQQAAEVLRDVFNEFSPSVTLGGAERVLASRLAEAGALAPELPGPVYEGSTTWEVPGEHEWQTDVYKGEVMLEVDVEEPGNFHPSTVSKTWYMKRDEARALAYALLAAAAHAEKENES